MIHYETTPEDLAATRRMQARCMSRAAHLASLSPADLAVAQAFIASFGDLSLTAPVTTIIAATKKDPPAMRMSITEAAALASRFVARAPARPGARTTALLPLATQVVALKADLAKLTKLETRAETPPADEPIGPHPSKADDDDEAKSAPAGSEEEAAAYEKLAGMVREPFRSQYLHRAAEIRVSLRAAKPRTAGLSEAQANCLAKLRDNRRSSLEILEDAARASAAPRPSGLTQAAKALLANSKRAGGR